MPLSFVLTLATLLATCMAGILACLATVQPRLGRSVWILENRIAHRLGRRTNILLFSAALLPVALRILLLAVDPVPQPNAMEEYNHIFQAETHALGRLANPVHPLSVMVQSFQQIGWPHFMSGRPPLSSIFMTVGQVLFGSPFVGNLLGISLTSLALCWMLVGWLPRRLAVLGSYIAITNWCLFGYWINAFWSPTPIVLGGALLMGVVPRVQRHPQYWHALLFTLGLLLLAGTRPYENAVYASAIGLWLTYHFLRGPGRPNLAIAMKRFALPTFVGAIAIIGAQLAYNEATTGNPLLMPYQVWRASQDITQTFLWQPIRDASGFYFEGAARFARWNASLVAAITNDGIFGFVQLIARHAVTFRDLVGPLLLLPFLCWSPGWLGLSVRSPLIILLGAIALYLVLLIPWGWAGAVLKLAAMAALVMRLRNQEDRLPAGLILIGFIATSLPSFYMSIYFTAFTGAILLLIVTGLRNLALWNRPLGASYAGFALLGCTLMPSIQTIAAAAGYPLIGPPLSQYDTYLASPRREVLATLAAQPGPHVIFVRSARLLHAELDPVWNSPDVDNQFVVWARDLRPEWTATAQRYYAGRRFWLMDMTANGAFKLQAYPVADLPTPVPLTDVPSQDRMAAQASGAHLR